VVTLIDTSIIIDYLRKKDKVNSPFTTLISQNYQSISIITYAELYSGKSVWETPKAKIILKTLCSNLIILPLTNSIAELAGKIKSKHCTDLADALIAATAIQHKLTLATLNIKDFSTIPHLQLIKI